MKTVRMCQIQINYKDGTSEKYDILLWDWFHNKFPVNPNKEVLSIERLDIYTIEMD